MSTVKLYYTDRNATYKNWELLPEKLLIVESISDYLATKTAMTIENFQYQKCEFEMGINVELAQSYAQPKTSLSFKYVSIQNTGEQVHYYFVKKAVWRSKTCVRFELVMDVLNTFQEGYDYTWKANTKITREHKDRYTRTKSITCTIDYYIESSGGSLTEGDRVQLINDNGGTVFIGTIIYIDNYYAYIQIENPTKEEDYINEIEPYLDFRFDLSKVDAVANFITFTPSNIDDFDFTTTFKYYRVIDYLPEGINPVLIRKSAPYTIERTGILKQNWYLLYRNDNDPDPTEYVNPVECYLIPENSVKTDSGVITAGRLVPSWCEDGKWYLFAIQSGKTATLSNGASVSFQSGEYHRLLITRAGGKLSVIYLSCTETQDMYVIWQYDDVSYVNFTGLPINYHVYNSAPSLNGYSLVNETFPESFSNTGPYNDLDPISSLDRADAKNIKCIKLPYCPYNFSYSGEVLQIDGSTDWERASFSQSQGGVFYALRLLNSNIKLQSSFTSGSANPFLNISVNITDVSEDDLRDINEVDSKLFHSAFYSPTYVYDSFALKIDLEKCDLSYYIENSVSTNDITFTMTKTINSKFMFTLADYVCDKSEVNFYNVLPIARNNEEVLYNVPYINFIKTGYNYEIKAKNTQNVSNFIGLGMSAASMGVALAMPSAPLKAATVVGALVSMAMSVKSTIVSAVQGEENIKQKLTQYSNQASSVAGSDDVDLMSEYCDNRLKYMVYEPTDNMKSLLNDLFFYAGYSSNRMAIPTHNNRLNFDYLECEASIEAAASIPQECLAELITCFKNGVVYLHKTTRATDKWDFAQKYENWEKSLLED